MIYNIHTLTIIYFEYILIISPVIFEYILIIIPVIQYQSLSTVRSPVAIVFDQLIITGTVQKPNEHSVTNLIGTRPTRSTQKYIGL